ncbi:MAG TPA: GWxTD domain-containing protein, partial [Bacteroidota bacterium]|nr:GWxTD domain-containing protein [Bacteroidota bacterium]
NLRGDIVQRDTIGQRLGAAKQTTFLKIKSSELVSGEYTIDVKAIPVSANSEQQSSSLTASSSRSFTMRWRELPHSIFDLDLAIDQLQYITERETIEDMKKAPPEKKREMWRDFWKKKDPTPSTERNEMMDEYFARVEYANKNFGHYLDGWKTDRGMIYIIFGPPSNIERHPFDSNAKPYEIWMYYEHSREFVFVDSTGFGDYRLETPIWDVWRTRPRQ